MNTFDNMTFGKYIIDYTAGLFRLPILLMAALLPCTSTAQVVLNEVCTYNGEILNDEDGDASDWIELYNAGSVPVNLLNYSLADQKGNSWFFPSVIIGQQQFLIVFASGKNRITPNLHTGFKLSRQGDHIRLRDAGGMFIDDLVTGPLQLNHSAGRQPDGSQLSQGIFEIPTPGASNNSSQIYSGYTTDPVFSHAAGFYNGMFQLTISAPVTGQIHFTTDGTNPTASSPVYTGPLLIDSNSVIKAKAYSPLALFLPSETITNTYLVDFDRTLPVVSISTDPANLFDWNTGIYVLGPNASPNYPYYGANFWQEWEVPANVEYFENGMRVINQTTGLAINGGSENRTRAMKSLRMTSRKKYGESSFHYQFFKEKPIDDFKIIVLRNASGDFNKAHFRDGSMHKLLSGSTNIDVLSYKPSVVYLNGSYWGVHNIRERVSRHYLKENHGIDSDNVDILEEDTTVIDGDFTAFNAMKGFVTGTDMSVQQNFDSAARWIDTESLIDYYVAETYLSNIDWPYNNMKYWREKKPGARWRYVLIDLDISLGNNGWAPASFDVLGRILGPYGDNNQHVQIFRSLLHNTQFRQQFINRYADLVNTLFTTEHMHDYLDGIRNTLSDEMPFHFARWGNSMQTWDQEYNQTILPYISDRPGYALEFVRDTFHLNAIRTLTLDVWPPEAGTITINTIEPGPLPWSGRYFDGNPVTVTIHPREGYHFVKWVSDAITIAAISSPEISFNPDADNKLIAWFATTSDPQHLTVFPNPASGNVTYGLLQDTDGTGKFELTDMLGRNVISQSGVPLQKGLNEQHLDVSALNSGVYIMRLTTGTSTLTAQLVIR
ncbi:MAG TPA: CotH kinase family protein [Bacteroidia bacterium]|nr:CotH kinase family protein [Bacteroidia bacterium]